MPVEAALARLRGGDIPAALALLQALPDGEPDSARHAALGMAHLAAGDAAAALAALRLAVALGDTGPTTLLNLALAEDRAGDPAHARTLMAGLKQAQPGWDEPALRLAESLRRSGQPAAAIAEYQATLDINPHRVEALLSLAALHMQMGRTQATQSLSDGPARAQMLLLRACAAAPDHAPAWDALGVALLLTGDAAQAESAFDQAQRLAPADATIALHRVEASLAAGTAETELARLEVASATDPLNPAPLVARGALLLHLGQAAQAIEVLEAATTLAPDSVPAAVALAHAMVGASQVAQAVPVLQRAIALAPDDADLRNNLAATLVRANRHREAREVLEALIAEHGESLGALCNLTNALVSLGLQQEGLDAARRAVALDPAAPLAWRAMCSALPYHPDVTAAALLDALRRTGETLPRFPAPLPAVNRDPERRLRVGLLSATLKTHPVGWLTVAGFENLDTAGFELVCLGQPPADDPIQRRFRAAAAEWHVVDGDAPERRVARLRELRLDVLIDLGGYGDRGMLAACASRVAPVQVKWVGAQNHSTGLAEMDWFISDRWETPPGSENGYSERLLLLRDGYTCYTPPAYAPDPVPLPALSRGAVTFGCFNNLAKITPVVLQNWAEILREIPDSRLVLKAHQLSDGQTRARILAAFPGIDPSRIELRGGSPHRKLLSEYNDIDIVLDPFPYSGGLTTCEALWMGVPTITMPGATFASRHSASHLSNIGLTDWIASDIPAYRALAARHAANLPALADLRAGMRARMKSSPLCDAPRFGQSLGIALRKAWRAYCETGG